MTVCLRKYEWEIIGILYLFISSKQYTNIFIQSRKKHIFNSKSKKRAKKPKERKVPKKQGKVKDSATNGLKKEVTFAPPMTKEDQALMLAQEQEAEMVVIKVEVNLLKFSFLENFVRWILWWSF